MPESQQDSIDEGGDSAPRADGRGEFEPWRLLSVVLGAVAIGLVAAWITADLVARWLSFPAAAVVSGYLLAGKDSRERFAFVGYAIAALLLLAPAAMLLSSALAGRSFQLSQTMTVVLIRFFLLVAAIVAYVTYRAAGGRGVLGRLRDPRSRRALAGYAVAAALLFLPVVLLFVDLFLGGSYLADLGAVVLRVLGVLGVGIGYAAYRVDSGHGVLETVRTGVG